MPIYKVWYQNKTEPLEFSSASRVREEQILDRIFEYENIAPDASSTLSERIEINKLAPVRYTEDESEPYTISQSVGWARRPGISGEVADN